MFLTVLTALLAMPVASAQSFSLPTSAADAGYFYITAYRDDGGHDWNCGSNHYSGHGGTDFGVGSWSGMYAGRDITSTADGTVIATHDGEWDECTSGACSGGGGCGNYVQIRNTDGVTVLYCHMRTWTVAVSYGQGVTCGQKIGEVGSSGYSTGPHLHFEPRNSSSFDPYSGPCGSSSSKWISQGSYMGLPALTCVEIDADGDGYTVSLGDCDDGDPAIHPGATEVCDHSDNDCDGTVDEPDAADASTWYADADGDGYGDPATSQRACWQPAGYVADDTDCNDANFRSHPGATEICDADDNDCDGVTDEGFDQDADGWRTCDGDCDDLDPTVNPGAPEVEDLLDNDCDFLVDEGTPVYDDDRDGWSERGGDCDDADPFTFPGAPEQPDGGDDDCDGLIDEGTVACDDDGDGFSERGGDCDDADPEVFPGAAETTATGDGDCDGLADEGTGAWDDDGDSFSEDSGDCDDADPRSFPGGVELADGRDNDCDGQIDDETDVFDDDGDGFSERRGDCDDADPGTYPYAPETADGRDDDCDGIVDDDTEAWDDDRDGWSEADGDCDDGREFIWPGAPELPDGFDGDCDGTVDEGTEAFDDDLDGYSEWEHDCDDDCDEVYPGAPERLDGRDEDCDGLTDDETSQWDDDRDGFSEDGGDCDDGNAQVHPGAWEPAGSATDFDCDGEVDQPRGWGATGCATGRGGGLGALLAAMGVVLGLGRRAQRTWLNSRYSIGIQAASTARCTSGATSPPGRALGRVDHEPGGVVGGGVSGEAVTAIDTG